MLFVSGNEDISICYTLHKGERGNSCQRVSSDLNGTRYCAEFAIHRQIPVVSSAISWVPCEWIIRWIVLWVQCDNKDKVDSKLTKDLIAIFCRNEVEFEDGILSIEIWLRALCVI